jgi:molybdopterin molybdotransferase
VTPASISFLASLGIGTVSVFDKPRVRIIVTGKELVPSGVALKEGKIYESNSAGLTAALKMCGIIPLSMEVIDDDETAIRHAINRASDSDIVILTGGASVGDYDFVPSSLEKCGVQKVFHKVRQKPGKPLYFGVENQTLFFGLPGNPAAVLSCFYQYIIPAISSFTRRTYGEGRKMTLTVAYKKKPGLTHFLKAKTDGDRVVILESQESYLMNSFALADCLIELEEDKEIFTAGDIVNVLMID